MCFRQKEVHFPLKNLCGGIVFAPQCPLVRKEIRMNYWVLKRWLLVPLVSTLVAGLLNSLWQGFFLLNSVFVFGFFLWAIPAFQRTQVESVKERRDTERLWLEVSKESLGDFVILYSALTPLWISLQGLRLYESGAYEMELASPIEPALLTFIGALILPFISLTLLTLLRSVASTRSRVSIFSIAALLLTVLIVLIMVHFTDLSWKHLASFLKELNAITLAHIASVLFTGLMILGLFISFMRITTSVINEAENKILELIGLASLIGAVDLLSIIQGFNGLREHYDFFTGLAFGGMLVAGMSFLLVCAFLASLIVKGFRQRNLTHYLLALELATAFGCLFLYLFAETSGYLIKYLL